MTARGRASKMRQEQDRTAYWNNLAVEKLVGRTITGAFYMEKQDADAFGWYGRAVVLELDNGVQLIPQTDDEGNGPGAISGAASNITTHFLLPVLH